MAKYDIYKDIAERTHGTIYVGVVGPVRTGKSTFIKKFMEQLVLPNMTNEYDKNRTQDEMPQSAEGKTIMTTEPKFIPSSGNNQGVEVKINDTASFKVKMVDCVGYVVKDANGYMENENPRMVTTPWFDEPVPFIEAAEKGTEKVIKEHSTIGLVITTDGSIVDIPRDSYVEAEEKVINELKEIDKPFVILLNSANPYSDETLELKETMQNKYAVPVMVVDCAHMKLEDINSILEKVLYEFPLKEIHIKLPKWVDSLEMDHWLKQNIINIVKEKIENIHKLRELNDSMPCFSEEENISEACVKSMELGEGRVELEMKPEEGLFYKILSEAAGMDIHGDYQLVSLLKEFADVKEKYSKVKRALEDANNKGYGIVFPQIDELRLEEPEIVKQGGRFGVKLRASAPSIHLVRADIETEVSPIVGTEKESEELVNYLLKEFENDPKKIWESDIFGKSLHQLVNEGLQNKLNRMPEDAQMKFQETLQRIINEGSGGVICILL